MERVLLVDDEHDLVWAIQHDLESQGYEVFTAFDGLEALSIAARYRPDLIVLDILMPGLNGLHVCERLQRETHLSDIPILFLSSLHTIEDRIKGLNIGADDYLGKPFDLQELKARIHALLRRKSKLSAASSEADNQDSVLTVGELILNLKTSCIQVRGTEAQLTPTEFDLLYYLMTHPGQFFSSQQLLENVWHYSPDATDPSLVRGYIKSLRSKIGSDPSQPAYIRTVPRHGYVFDVHSPLTQP